jgi:hypothetical protein
MIVSSACFSFWRTKLTCWLTRSAVVAAGVIRTSAGSVRKRSARSRIVFGIVAEKNSV